MLILPSGKTAKQHQVLAGAIRKRRGGLKTYDVLYPLKSRPFNSTCERRHWVMGVSSPEGKRTSGKVRLSSVPSVRFSPLGWRFAISPSPAQRSRGSCPSGRPRLATRRCLDPDGPTHRCIVWQDAQKTITRTSELRPTMIGHSHQATLSEPSANASASSFETPSSSNLPLPRSSTAHFP